MGKEQKAKKVLTIDPKEVHEGACHIHGSEDGSEKFVVCKENGKIKIFQIEKEE